MDVRTFRALGLLIALLIMAACGKKSSSSVFPESTQSNQCESQRILTRFIVQWEDGRITFERAENKDVFIDRFIKPNLQSIRHVEFDKLVFVPTQARPAASAPNQDWGQEIVEASAAWDQGIQGQNIKVAVVDTAIDETHPQLLPRLNRNSAEIAHNGIDDDGNGFIDDVFGWDFVEDRPGGPIASDIIHGTHVSGIVLADPDTGSMSGVAPKAELLGASFIKEDGGALSDAIRALKYAASRDVRVINASWGGPGCPEHADSQTLKEVIASLEKRNILFVTASGNDNLNLDAKSVYPATFDLANQLTIGATNWMDRLTGFSNTSYRFVHLAAPGEWVYSTVPGGYAFLDGTSMATPFVSGAAALLWSAKPQASVAQIKTALLNSVDSRDYRVMTRGRLNVRKALDEIRRLVP